MLPPVDSSAILKMRQQILARSDALGAPFGQGAANTGLVPGAGGIGGAGTPAPRFGAALDTALRQVSAIQDQASAAVTAFETGQTHDLASVMVARQKASLAFEATLQARNRLIGAYKDVMNMPL
ncbi:flagellar hook-basal body complex protein FliE [Sandarakinorhabdus sp.]|uniref:flagellar hook-basal body complex protein FliE n=1 Tax=Sandarakinorhabdus sp. TaxID=1916663 RepID=UPI003340EB0B